MIWRAFRKPQPAASHEVWWRHAEQAAADPTPDRLAALAAALPDAAATADDVEQLEEMIDGLRALAAVRGQPLPVLHTQHRAIGADSCHLIAPVGLAGDAGAPGKIFATANRLVFVGARTLAWPWHRVRQVARRGREIVVVAAGAADPLHVQCNSLGDALVLEHVIARLSAPGGATE